MSAVVNQTHISKVELVVCNDLCTLKHVLARTKCNTELILYRRMEEMYIKHGHRL